MTKMYRFRSTTKLLGDFQELEKQSIYFASPEELNDPMEGFRDVVWQGDRIVWTNLFRHYLYCLYITYLLCKIAGNNKEIEPQDISMIGPGYPQMSPKAVNLFEDICSRVFEKGNIQGFIASMVNTNRKARHDEMRFYLQALHYTALLETQNAFINHGFIDHGLFPDSKELKKYPSIFKILHNIPDIAQQIGDEKSNIEFASLSREIEGGIIYHKYKVKSESTSTFEKNRQLLSADFPSLYLKQLGELLYRNEVRPKS